jgi:hypothetical protein
MRNQSIKHLALITNQDPAPILFFGRFHGYTPLLIFVNQLAIGLNQNEYSLFNLNSRLTAI